MITTIKTFRIEQAECEALAKYYLKKYEFRSWFDVAYRCFTDILRRSNFTNYQTRKFQILDKNPLRPSYVSATFLIMYQGADKDEGDFLHDVILQTITNLKKLELLKVENEYKAGEQAYTGIFEVTALRLTPLPI